MIHVTDASFEDTISSNKLVLIDFWADWCGPCKKMLPILQEIHDEGTVPIGKLNADENPINSDEYSVQSIPTMVLFVDGQPVHTIVGAKPKHIILKELSQWI
jgi:thioredoxin 1